MASGNININIIVEGDGGKASGFAGGSDGQNNVATKSADVANNKTWKSLAVGYAVKDVKSVVFSGLSRVGMYSGNSLQQQRMDWAMEKINDISSIGIATMAGASFGPIGAAVGFIGGASSLGIKYALRVSDYEFHKSQSFMETKEILQRAGPAFNFGRG